jgi:hypothetical protein
VLSFLDDRTPVENKIGRIINKDKDDNKKMLVQAGHKLEIPCMTRAAKWNTKSQTGHAPKCNVETMQWTKHTETLNWDIYNGFDKFGCDCSNETEDVRGQRSAIFIMEAK